MKIEFIPCKSPKTCKACGASFPNWVLIDGVRKNLRARSYCLDCSPWGAHNTKRLSVYRVVNDVEHKLCPNCEEWKPLDGFHTAGTKDYHRQSWCKPCLNGRSRELAATLKSKAVAYKGGACHDCGENFPDYIYDFHHRDPEDKDFKISHHLTRNLDWQAVTQELDKCDLLCANCHRHRHYNPNHPAYCPIRRS